MTRWTRATNAIDTVQMFRRGDQKEDPRYDAIPQPTDSPPSYAQQQVSPQLGESSSYYHSHPQGYPHSPLQSAPANSAPQPSPAHTGYPQQGSPQPSYSQQDSSQQDSSQQGSPPPMQSYSPQQTGYEASHYQNTVQGQPISNYASGGRNDTSQYAGWAGQDQQRAMASSAWPDQGSEYYNANAYLPQNPQRSATIASSTWPDQRSEYNNTNTYMPQNPQRSATVDSSAYERSLYLSSRSHTTSALDHDCGQYTNE